MKLVSKSIFLDYLTCPKDAWFHLHHPELKKFEISETQQNIYNLGNEVEEYAKKLNIFSGMTEVDFRDSDGEKKINELIAQKATAIYQPTFIADGYIIRCDVIVWNKSSNNWDLYEVKGSTSRKDTGERDHISDVAFQAVVLERYGIPIGRTYIVHLKKEYVREGDIDIEALFVISDCTAKVEARKLTIADEMEKAKQYLNQEKEPRDGCDCHFYGRSSHCSTFSISHPEIPEYSIHDLSYIGKSPDKLKQLVEESVYHLTDIEDTSDFTDAQQNQIETHRTNREIINKEEIANILSGYAYPLYFFDYETFAPAVPVYDGYSPYQRMPIQFSLHIIDKEGSPLRHVDYLHEENSDPSEAIAKHLIENINPLGTVLAWNVGFERSVTNELASRLSEYEAPLQRICGQMQDLMDVFSKQHYVHKDFRGRVAIESVMNVLLPEMTYDHLPYTGQGVGFVWWSDVVNKGSIPSERPKKIHLIKEYCKQDTLVMVEIWDILRKIIIKS